MRTQLLTASLIALGLAGTLAPVLPVRADRNDDYPIYQNRTSINLDATVSSVDVDRDRVIVAGDDGRTYTVDTYRSAITLRGTNRSGETGDLVPGMRLHITGSRLSNDIVEADRVSVQPYRSGRPTLPMPGRRTNDPYQDNGTYRDNGSYRDTDPYGDDNSNTYRNGQAGGFELRGTVESVDNRRGSFTIRVNNHTRTVYVNDATDLGDLSRNGSRGNNRNRVPLRSGDRVTVFGTLQTDGTVTADSISLGSLSSGNPYRNDNQYGRGNQVQGVVTSTSSRYMNRDIKVRLSSGREVTIHVPKDVQIRRDGRGISVHEIQKDDEVRIQGRYDGNDFQASRIDVTDSYSNNNNRRNDNNPFGF